MRIVLFANNWVGLKIAQYLVRRGEQIIALGIHEKEKQKFTEEIIDTVSPKLIFTGKELKKNEVLLKIKKLNPDIIIAAFWGYLLSANVLKIPKKGCINFHPGFLPYNRGMNPNVWPFIEGTPAGVTIHYMDNGIDTGGIIAQKKIPIDAIDTAGSIEKKTWIEIVRLFKKTWPKLKRGLVKSKKQDNSVATFHLAKDVNRLDYIDLDKSYKARDLLNMLRARSYKNHSFAHFIEKGEKIFVNIKLKRQ